MKLPKIILLLALSLMLVSCGEKLSYRYADWIIGWVVDDYVDWNKPQQKQYDQAIDELLIWHKQSQLLRYRDWLIDFKVITQQQPDATTLINALQPLEGFSTDILVYIFEDTKILLSSLSDKQVAEMLDALQEQQEDYEDDYRHEAPKKWRKRQLKTIKKISKRFIGKLTSEQQTLVDHWVDKQQDLNSLWLDSRQRWIEQFAHTLAIRQVVEKKQDFKGKLSVLFLEPKKLHNPHYAAAIDHNIENSAELMAALLASLNNKQRKKLDKQLDKYIDLLESLAL